MDIKKNLKEGLISDVVGGTVILASIISVFIPSLEIDWVNAVAGITLGADIMGLIKK